MLRLLGPFHSCWGKEQDFPSIHNFQRLHTVLKSFYVKKIMEFKNHQSNFLAPWFFPSSHPSDQWCHHPPKQWVFKPKPTCHLYIYFSNNSCLTEDPWICLFVSTFTTLIQPQEEPPNQSFFFHFIFLRSVLWGFPGSSVSKETAVHETRVQSLGQEDLLEKEMETRCNILAWRTPWTEELDRLQSTGSQEVDTT